MKAPEPAQPADRSVLHVFSASWSLALKMTRTDTTHPCSTVQPSVAVAQVKQEPAPATGPALQAVVSTNRCCFLLSALCSPLSQWLSWDLMLQKEEPEAVARTSGRAAVSATGDAARTAIPAPKPRLPSRSAAVDARPQPNRRGGQGEPAGAEAQCNRCHAACSVYHLFCLPAQVLVPSAMLLPWPAAAAGQASGHSEAMARRNHSPVIFPPPGLQHQQQHNHQQQQQQQQQQRQQQRGLGNGMPRQGLGNGMFQPMPFGRMPQLPGPLLMESLQHHPGARPALPMPQQPGGFGGQVQRPSLPMPPGQQRRAERARLQEPEGKTAHKVQPPQLSLGRGVP